MYRDFWASVQKLHSKSKYSIGNIYSLHVLNKDKAADMKAF